MIGITSRGKYFHRGLAISKDFLEKHSQILKLSIMRNIKKLFCVLSVEFPFFRFKYAYKSDFNVKFYQTNRATRSLKAAWTNIVQEANPWDQLHRTGSLEGSSNLTWAWEGQVADRSREVQKETAHFPTC